MHVQTMEGRAMHVQTMSRSLHLGFIEPPADYSLHSPHEELEDNTARFYSFSRGLNQSLANFNGKN